MIEYSNKSIIDEVKCLQGYSQEPCNSTDILKHELDTFGINIKTSMFDEFIDRHSINIAKLSRLLKIPSGINTLEKHSGFVNLVYINKVHYRTSKAGNRYVVLEVIDVYDNSYNLMLSHFQGLLCLYPKE